MKQHQPTQTLVSVSANANKDQRTRRNARVPAIFETSFVRQAANQAMQELGTRAIPILIRTLEDRDPEARECAARALESITGLSFARAECWRIWWKEAKLVE